MAVDIANDPPTPIGGGGTTVGSGLTISGGVLTNDLLTGKAGGQTAKGGTAAGETLTLRGTAHSNNDGAVIVTSANTVSTTPVLQVESTAASGYALISLRANGAERGGLRSDFGGTTRLYAAAGLELGAGGGATTPSLKVLSTGETVVQQGLYGGTGASGTFTLSSTSNATKGSIYFGSSTGLNYDETNKRLGIGITPVTPSVHLDRSGSSGAFEGLWITDSNGATNTLSTIRIQNNTTVAGTDGLTLACFGTGYTTAGLLTAHLGLIEHNPSSAAHLIISNTGAAGSSILFATSSGRTERMQIDAAGNVTIGTAALATNATDGFLYVDSCAGTPTGVPTAKAGRVALVYDTTNNKFAIYNGAWKQTVALT